MKKVDDLKNCLIDLEESLGSILTPETPKPIEDIVADIKPQSRLCAELHTLGEKIDGLKSFVLRLSDRIYLPEDLLPTESNLIKQDKPNG
jgi:hypothetical protein